MWTAVFWQAAVERALKTFAQALAALLIAAGTDLVSTAWGASLAVAGMASVISVLTSLASAGAGRPGPSLTTETVEPAAEHVAEHRA